MNGYVSEEVNIKKVAGAYTMDTILQVAFGVKVDSMIDTNNPVIVHAKKIFTKDINVKQIIRFMIAFTMPGLLKYFGNFVRNPVFDYFEKFALKIIEQKRIEFGSKENLGKANNFIELLLEAEAEGLELKSNKEEKSVKCMLNFYFILLKN